MLPCWLLPELHVPRFQIHARIHDNYTVQRCVRRVQRTSGVYPVRFPAGSEQTKTLALPGTASSRKATRDVPDRLPIPALLHPERPPGPSGGVSTSRHVEPNTSSVENPYGSHQPRVEIQVPVAHRKAQGIIPHDRVHLRVVPRWGVRATEARSVRFHHAAATPERDAKGKGETPAPNEQQWPMGNDVKQRSRSLPGPRRSIGHTTILANRWRRFCDISFLYSGASCISPSKTLRAAIVSIGSRSVLHPHRALAIYHLTSETHTYTSRSTTTLLQ